MKSARLLGLFLLASCSAELGGETPPTPVDAGIDQAAERAPEPEPEPEPDAGPDVSVADRTVEAGRDRDPFADSWKGDGGSGNFFDTPDGQCWIPPVGAPWFDTDDAGVAYCLYPPDSWQRTICECIFTKFLPDAAYDRDR